MKKFKLLCAVLVLCFSTFNEAYAEDEPVQTIHAIQAAIVAADQEAFDNNVNMESLVGQCVDIFIEEVNNGNIRGLPTVLSFTLAAASKNQTTADALKSKLVDEISEYVRYGVASGAYAGRTPSGATPSGILSNLLANASLGRKEFTNIGEAIPESGAVYVSFTLVDHGNGNSYPIEAWLRDENNNWRVIGIRNVRTLMRIIAGESG